jgi:hypothetical protein
MIKNSYLLYGTLGCHLCEQAEQLLTQIYNDYKSHKQ